MRQWVFVIALERPLQYIKQRFIVIKGENQGQTVFCRESSSVVFP